MNLNPAHLHIMLNHIPLFGALFAALLIAWGLLRKSEDVLRLGLALGFVVGIATYGVLLTGEPAEEVVEHLADVSRRTIHAHEEAAEWATYVIAAAGLVSLVALLLVRRRHRAGRGLSILALVLSLVGFASRRPSNCQRFILILEFIISVSRLVTISRSLCELMMI